ncbi:MAG TPA: DEAD/DEAH box helicase [Acidimicrobiales bacterium]|nr:DEAD/DEAH box helicase [Acidimicrobiales bacterium]
MLILDPFQRRAASAIDRGESVLVAAPTGAGKTLVADHAIDRALARNAKAFYTTPLKALSNQKFRDLVFRLGPDRVGLLTGDRAVRPDAPVVVMTTEVLRALLYDRGPILSGLSVIVLDEFHYLQDPDRGPVWEEVVIHAPRDVAIVGLSATLPDLPELHRWLVSTHGPTELVVEEQRPVTLQFLYAVGNLQGTPPLVLPMFLDGRINPMAELQDGTRKVSRGEGKRVRDRSRPVTPRRSELLNHLRTTSMLPAIWFVLSRNGCDRAVADLVTEGVRLTTPDETDAIADLVRRSTEGLSASELKTLDSTGWRLALACGIAAHHGGLAPVQREVVELAAAEGLVKVVFATETLALGVNLPARTVVIDRVTRANGPHGGETLTTAEFAQLAGRAGRRGLDRVGNVIVPWSPDIGLHRVTGLAGGRADVLVSHYRATPAMVANLVHSYAPEEGRTRFRRSLAHHLLRNSLVDLRETLADRVAALEELDEEGDVAADDAVTEDDGGLGSRIAAVVAGLALGDVVVDPGRASVGRLAVVDSPRVRRGQPTIDTVRPDCRRVVVAARDFRLPPVVVARVDLSDLGPGARGFARSVAARIRDLPAQDHPTAPPPAHVTRKSDASMAVRRQRLVEEIGTIRERLEHEAAAHEHEFDAVADLLRRRGHLDGWALTQSGRMVRRLFHERGLLVAECLAAGIFDDLDPPSLAAAVSAFRSGTRQELAPSPFPTSQLRERWVGIDAIASDLQRTESDNGLRMTPAPDSALLTPTHRWTAGAPLGDALAGTALGPGDLAREVRQVLELLEQIVAVAPPPIASTASTAIDAMSRGVVVATAHVEGQTSSVAGTRSP